MASLCAWFVPVAKIVIVGFAAGLPGWFAYFLARARELGHTPTLHAARRWRRFGAALAVSVLVLGFFALLSLDSDAASSTLVLGAAALAVILFAALLGVVLAAYPAHWLAHRWRHRAEA